MFAHSRCLLIFFILLLGYKLLYILCTWVAPLCTSNKLHPPVKDHFKKLKGRWGRNVTSLGNGGKDDVIGGGHLTLVSQRATHSTKKSDVLYPVSG